MYMEFICRVVMFMTYSNVYSIRNSVIYRDCDAVTYGVRETSCVRYVCVNTKSTCV